MAKTKNSKNKNNLPLFLAVITIGILILAGIKYYDNAVTPGEITQAAVVQVQFADGTTKTFDSSTMALGALYNPSTNAAISVIGTAIYITPVVKTSDGSYPTSLPPGYSLTRNDHDLPMKILVNGADIGLTVPVLIPQGGTLTPNTGNVLVNSALRATELSQIDNAAGVASGSTFTIQYKLVSTGGLGAKLTKPDGTYETKIASTTIAAAPVITMTLKKVTTSTYTLESVSIRGAFS